MEFSQELLQQMANGVALGSIYALLALGYTMVYGVIKLINFAHGDILMLGAFGGYFVLTRYGVGMVTLILAFATAMFFCALLGVIIEWICYKPLRNAPRINALITAIGVSLLLENGARVLPVIGPNFREFPLISKLSYPFCGIRISLIQVLVFGVAVLLMILLHYFVGYTKTGKAMRAVAFDRGAAYLMGINVDRIVSLTFALGSALAAAAGLLYASAYPQLEPYMGIIPGLKAFIAAVLGGIGSIPGAMLGGFIMGIAETLTKGFISSQLADAIAFGILIGILIVKPSGIMGKNVSDKV
ncbi:MAG TPA: branched-chain amino acid ABC transporter permease [Bacillota bacterium]|nr:branched-chain amino acid ABC transporter permease [Bacillota bacterium]